MFSLQPSLTTSPLVKPELPLPLEILVRVAKRCRVSSAALLDRWDSAIEHPLRTPANAEEQPDAHRNCDAAQTQPESSPRGTQPQAVYDPGHPDFAFYCVIYYGTTELMKHAQNFDNPRDSFVNYVRNISSYIRHHADVATHALLNNVDRLEDIENILYNHIGDGVGARLRVTLDQFYENGFYDALFERLLREERQMVAANHVDPAVVDIVVAESGKSGS